MMKPELARAVESRVEELGYELVEMEEAGSARRPILRLKIDLPDSEPGKGVGLDDCVRVSRALEAELDQRADIAATYVLEVSSPGVERPLVKRRDFERFAGREVALVGKAPLAGRERRLEGELTGLSGGTDGEVVGLRLADGEVVEVPRGQITRAHLIFRDDRRGRTRG
jgi:ribosome maturation factor RimP